MASATLDLKSPSAVREGRSPLQDAFQQLLKNRASVYSGIFIILLFILAIFANDVVITWIVGGEPTPVLAPHPYDGQNFSYSNSPALTTTDEGEFYLLGTDYIGRDTLSRTIFGTRISLAVAIIAATVSLIVGVVYGLISGYGSPRRDNVMMRFVDFLYGFPAIIAIILIQVVVKAYSNVEDLGGPFGFLISINNALGGIFFVFVALGLFGWIGMARITRGLTLSFKNKEFVEAARSIGNRDYRIIFSHILPNVLGPCIVFETLAIPGYILTEAFLSFIGLGANPPTPSWGMMISETVGALRTYPWQVFTPAIALTVTVLAFNFLGDGLRDAFDPRLRGE